MSRPERIDGKLASFSSDIVKVGVLPSGPWHDEPDHVDFESHGFSCILHRGSAWCGYVAVPPGHPWHGKSYGEVRTVDDDWPDVHGGLTYAEKCAGAICHVARPGESDDVWWLGFDCAHHGDATLWDIADGSVGSEFCIYRDLAYVRYQTEWLAAQARAVSP